MERTKKKLAQYVAKELEKEGWYPTKPTQDTASHQNLSRITSNQITVKKLNPQLTIYIVNRYIVLLQDVTTGRGLRINSLVKGTMLNQSTMVCGLTWSLKSAL